MSIDYTAIAEAELSRFKSKYKPIDDNKYAFFTMGIPASGKSSSVSYILKEMNLPTNSVVQLDPDDIMSRLHGYSDKLSPAQKTKFNRAAIIITSKILDNLIAEGISFVYFGTGRSHQSYSRYMRKTTKKDFINVLINVELDLEEAIKRNSKRNRSLGRNIITNINSTLRLPIKEGKPDTRLDQYQKLCDIVFSVNTSTKPPKILLIKSIDGGVNKSANARSSRSANSRSARSTNAKPKSATMRSVTSTRKSNKRNNSNISRSTNRRSVRKRKTVKYKENSSSNSDSN